MPGPILDELKIEETKQQLAEFVAQGRLDQGVAQFLASGSYCVPVECELLDYKETLEDSRYARAKAVISIVSFYNTFGGYLVFGVTEKQSETDFELVGVSKDVIDAESLKALVKEYTGVRVQLALQYFPLSTDELPDRRGDYLAVLYVPKRSENEPLAFGKNGPGDEKNRPIFSADDVYYRKGDECIIAKGKAILYLAGPRACPYQKVMEPIDGLATKRARLFHNLPDRGFICPRFIGRTQIIEDLWSWFGDDFSHVRVLAGEGGLGKTSIAYQFAEDVCTTTDSELERIIWLTAKQKQFSGIHNQLVDVPETHFTSFAELLRVLCAELGYLPGELADASEKLLKKYIQHGAQVTPSLIVIDDVDSLEPDEQRKVLEIGFLFGNTKSRLLLTTRANQSYSSEIALQISGFDPIEYRTFLDSLHKRYTYVSLDPAQIQSMHTLTEGSPLFTESLYRLMRWMRPSDAMREWRGHMGEEARAAAIRKEIEQLSPESKRVLLAMAYLGECSYTELQEIAAYPDTVLGDCVDELRSLYLMHAPQITEEVRFRIGLNAGREVLTGPAALATDHVRLEQRVIELRSQTKRLRARRDNPLVGAAIKQAMAQLRQGKTDSALETVLAAEMSCKGHPDLLALQARCLLKCEPPRADDARKVARKAYEKGSRRDVLFDVWYEAEWVAGHFNGAAEAAEGALKSGVAPEGDWYIRRAAALWHIANAQVQVGNIDRAISDYWACDSDLSKAQTSAATDEQKELRTRRFAVHDLIWIAIREYGERSVDSAARAIDELRRMIRLKDFRITVYLHLCEALGWLTDVIDVTGRTIPEGLQNLVEQRIREVHDEVESLARLRPTDSRLPYVREQLGRHERAYQEIGQRRGFHGG